MASAVEICNLAISHGGAGHTIQALTESSVEARQCNLLYDKARRATLRSHPWNFATKRVTLALLTDTYTGWTYAYSYPTDCLNVIEILNPLAAIYSDYSLTATDRVRNRYATRNKVEYKVISNDDKNARVVLCNLEDAEMEYTADITDVNMFDPLFVEALAWRLAADLSMPLRGDLQQFDLLERKFFREISKAAAESSNEDQKDPEDRNNYVGARL